MSVRPSIVPEEVDAAWQFFLVNWIGIGAVGAVLACSLLLTDFSIELAGLAIAICYVGLYAGFAHANARSPRRRDPQVMFVLGGTAQIVLLTAVMTPLTYGAASADFPMQDRAYWPSIARSVSIGRVMSVMSTPILPSPRLMNCGYAMIRWPIFAIPVVLAALGRYRRIEEFTFAFGLALFCHHADLGAGAGDRRLSTDRARSRQR